MIIYRVTINIKKDVEEEWLNWMKTEHIDEVMRTGYFTKWEILKQLIPESVTDESIYTVRYHLESFSGYELYAKNDAARLQNKHTEKFPGKFKASRAVYQMLD